MPDTTAAFIRFLQLKSARARTQESCLAWVRRVAAHHGVACAAMLSEEQVLAFIHRPQVRRHLVRFFLAFLRTVRFAIRVTISASRVHRRRKSERETVLVG